MVLASCGYDSRTVYGKVFRTFESNTINTLTNIVRLWFETRESQFLPDLQVVLLRVLATIVGLPYDVIFFNTSMVIQYTTFAWNVYGIVWPPISLNSGEKQQQSTRESTIT